MVRSVFILLVRSDFTFFIGSASLVFSFKDQFRFAPLAAFSVTCAHLVFFAGSTGNRSGNRSALFLRLQELSMRNITRTSSASAALLSTPSSNLRLATSLPRPQH
jgi:hypothetical protein